MMPRLRAEKALEAYNIAVIAGGTADKSDMAKWIDQTQRAAQGITHAQRAQSRDEFELALAARGVIVATDEPPPVTIEAEGE